MFSFKQHLLEAELLFKQQRLVPHVPLVDWKKDPQGKIIRIKNDIDRMEHLTSTEPPLHQQSPLHLQLHDIVNRMEQEKFRFPYKGTNVLFSNKIASIVRMYNNGATSHDMQEHLNDQRFEDQDDLQTRSSSVYLTAARHALNQYQAENGIEEANRINLDTVLGTHPRSALPGKLSHSAYLRHPDLRHDVEHLASDEFFNKHLARFHGKRWQELDNQRGGEADKIRVMMSRARSQLGIKLPPEEASRRQVISRIRSTYL